MKYLGVQIDENLNWKDQTYGIITKLNRANALHIKLEIMLVITSLTHM